jgi:hypothetical protein
VEPLERPDTQGDQLVFYYDARASHTSFLTVRNASTGGITVSVVFYGPTFSTPFTRTIDVPAGGLRVLDAGALKEDGLPAQQGVAFATVVDGGEPVVSFALTGSFTVANLATGSAWGSPALARSALNDPEGSLPALGAAINGSTVVLQPIRPEGLELASFYNPTTLAPVENGGNEIIFIAFEDVPGETYSATVGATTWDLFAAASNGDTVADTSFNANGVTPTDLVTLLGSDANGAAGSVRFIAIGGSAPLSRMIFFAEALGTFGTGYLLPSFPVVL